MPLTDLMTETNAPLLVRDHWANGDPGPITAALAQVPELCEVTLPFVGAALGASGVSVRRKEIAIVRTSANLACRYCTDTHTVVGATEGLTVQELRALRDEVAVEDVFTDQTELALIAWVDELSTRTGAVDPITAVTAKGLLGDHQLVELTVTVGATMFLNRFATALGLPVSGGTEARLADLGFEAFDPTPVAAATAPASTPPATTLETVR